MTLPPIEKIDAERIVGLVRAADITLEAPEFAAGNSPTVAGVISANLRAGVLGVALIAAELHELNEHLRSGVTSTADVGL